jgi:hypothetical protein
MVVGFLPLWYLVGYAGWCQGLDDSLGWELSRKFARQGFEVLSLIVSCGYFGVNTINKLLREWNDWS